MKMNIYLIYFVISLTIALLSTACETQKEDKKSYGIRIFFISYITIYIGMMFLNSTNEINHEIMTGDPPF